MPLRDIVGHRAARALLSRVVVRSGLPQSLIFAGPDGVGKRLTAVALAQLLNCPSRLEHPHPDLAIDACGVCSSCRRIGQLAHPDVVVVAANPSIDEAREVMQTAAFRPFEGRRRVFVLDDADAMSVAVQSAWLKMLEEPPSTSHFVLVTSRPDLVLPTVRSRCPTLRFGRLAVDTVARLLVERHGLDPDEAREAAFASDGSLGTALREASDAGSETRAIVERVVSGVVDARSPVDRLRLATHLLEAVEARGKGRGKTVTRWGSERDLLAGRLQVLGGMLRDLAVTASGGDDRLLAHAPTAETSTLARRWGHARLTLAFAAVGRAREALDRNASAKTVADWLAMQL
jgi:DNA polymerase-3 subunit delta'